MRALCWHGTKDVRVDTVNDPKIEDPKDINAMIDKMPFGAVVNKGLTIRSGQTHMQHYMEPLLKKIEDKEIDPSFVITHRVPVEQAPLAYEKFEKKEDGCIKVVLQPG